MCEAGWRVGTLVDVVLSGHQVVAQTQMTVMERVEVSAKQHLVPLLTRLPLCLGGTPLTRLYEQTQTQDCYKA